MPSLKLPERDVLNTLLKSGRTPREIAALYGTTYEAVRLALKNMDLWDSRPNSKTTYRKWIPWTVSVMHDDAYPLEMLRKYIRVQEGQPLISPELEAQAKPLIDWAAVNGLPLDTARGNVASGLRHAFIISVGAEAAEPTIAAYNRLLERRRKARMLDTFMMTMNAESLVVDYNRQDGFKYVPRRSGDRHYVRWPAGVEDTRP